jgi:hypothetical protein
MNINASIIDQQVRGLADRLKLQLAEALEKQLNDVQRRSAAFVLLCVKTLLDLPDDEALERLTEGGNDFGVDAIDLAEVTEGEFTVTLFQAKYKHENLEGESHFPENGVTKAVQAVGALFNPQAPVTLNPRLQARIEEIRSLISDGYIPRVRYVLCNNGLRWKEPEAQEVIDRARFPERVRFEHANHDVLVQILQDTQPVKDTIQFTGKSVVEDFNFSRVFVGKVAVGEVARLMDAHGDRLLERNIRRYLGLQGNRVNEGIRLTLSSEAERPNFFFYNNGITLICRQFDYNALQNENHKVRVERLQIINGGQTCKTIQATLKQLIGNLQGLDTAFVLVRLYQLGENAGSLVSSITYATNSQNPVDLRDLRSNDPIQKQLEISVRELGYEYKPKRSDIPIKSSDITSAVAAEAVLSTWRRAPQQAKFRNSEHFGSLYEKIFDDSLNGAQLVIAVLLYRIAENKRRRPPDNAPEFVRYASCFAAMLMGQYLLIDMDADLNALDHRSFEQARTLVDKKGDKYFAKAVNAIKKAIRKLYGSQDVSLQQLSATFRRGDLTRYLSQ